MHYSKCFFFKLKAKRRKSVHSCFISWWHRAQTWPFCCWISCQFNFETQLHSITTMDQDVCPALLWRRRDCGQDEKKQVSTIVYTMTSRAEDVITIMACQLMTPGSTCITATSPREGFNQDTFYRRWRNTIMPLNIGVVSTRWWVDWIVFYLYTWWFITVIIWLFLIMHRDVNEFCLIAISVESTAL